MVYCAVSGCNHHSARHKGVSFFRFPAVIHNQCKKTKELSEARRAAWIAKINRAGFTEDSLTKDSRVCSAHFVQGKPSKLFDNVHPDWVPSCNLGYNQKGNAENDRYERSRKCQCLDAGNRDEVSKGIYVLDNGIYVLYNDPCNCKSEFDINWNPSAVDDDEQCQEHTEGDQGHQVNGDTDSNVSYVPYNGNYISYNDPSNCKPEFDLSQGSSAAEDDRQRWGHSEKGLQDNYNILEKINIGTQTELTMQDLAKLLDGK